jgi:hypothetical protein
MQHSVVTVDTPQRQIAVTLLPKTVLCGDTNGKPNLWGVIVSSDEAAGTGLSPLTLRIWIPPRRGALDTTLRDKVCQWLAAGRWFSLGSPVFSTKTTDRHDIGELLLKCIISFDATLSGDCRYTTEANSCYITTKDSIMWGYQCVIKFVSDLQQADGFLWVLRFFPQKQLTATI